MKSCGVKPVVAERSRRDKCGKKERNCGSVAGEKAVTPASERVERDRWKEWTAAMWRDEIRKPGDKSNNFKSGAECKRRERKSLGREA